MPAELSLSELSFWLQDFKNSGCKYLLVINYFDHAPVGIPSMPLT